MSDNPACSICIANYNGESTLTACLNSVFAQQNAPPFEVLIHDDASTDNSVALIATKFPNARLLKSSENVGFCTSNNRLAAAARGKYLLLLNNDAALRTGALSYLFHEAELGFQGILGLPQYDMDTGDLLDRGSLFDIFLNSVPNRDMRRHEVGMVMGACLWIPKELWITVGGFPEWFESLAEDLFLCFAARNLGFGVRVLPNPGYDHRVGQSFGGGKLRDNKLSTTYRRRSLSERNKTFVMILFFPPALLAIVLPLHLVLLATEGLVLALLKRDADILRKIYLPCLAQIWRFRSSLLPERDKIQAVRKTGMSQLLRNFVITPYKLQMLIRHGLPQIK